MWQAEMCESENDLLVSMFAKSSQVLLMSGV